MRRNTARREIGASELPRSDEAEHVRVDLRSQRFDAIPNERIASVLIAVKETNLQRHTFARERPRQSPGLDHDAVIDHGGDRMRGVLVAEKFGALAAVGEAQPCARQIAAFAFDQVQGHDANASQIRDTRLGRRPDSETLAAC